jgi:hypothetical protein
MADPGGSVFLNCDHLHATNLAKRSLHRELPALTVFANFPRNLAPRLSTDILGGTAQSHQQGFPALESGEIEIGVGNRDGFQRLVFLFGCYRATPAQDQK